MERATHTAFEPRFVVEDTCAVHAGGHIGAITLLAEPLAVFSLCMMLPVSRLQALDALLDRCQVLLVDEMSSVTATALLQFGGIVIEHTLATATVDALIVGTEERGIDHPGLILVGIAETEPFVEIGDFGHGASH